MILDILDDRRSYFYSHERFVYDSIMKNRQKEVPAYAASNLDFTNVIDKSKVNFAVTKNHQKSEKTLHLNLDGQNYAIKDTGEIKWLIHTEKKEIRGLAAQKATAHHLGRNWTAWFSTDYPISDGPYKLTGLPGLILEAADDKNDHSFVLLGIKKINNLGYGFYDRTKEIEVDNRQFNKLWDEYKNDPAKSYRNRMSNSGINYSISMNGTSDPQEIIRQIEINEKEKIKKFNNFIELDLFR